MANKNFTDDINKVLADYKEFCENVVFEDLDKAGKVALDKVKSLSPVAAASYKKWEKNATEISPGKYKKSWRKKTEGKNTSKPEMVVYSGQYQITHLLENGHVKKGGGRVRGYPHVAPAQDAADAEIERLLAKDLGGG